MKEHRRILYVPARGAGKTLYNLEILTRMFYDFSEQKAEPVYKYRDAVHKHVNYKLDVCNIKL